MKKSILRPIDAAPLWPRSMDGFNQRASLIQGSQYISFFFIKFTFFLLKKNTQCVTLILFLLQKLMFVSMLYHNSIYNVRM